MAVSTASTVSPRTPVVPSYVPLSSVGSDTVAAIDGVVAMSECVQAIGSTLLSSAGELFRHRGEVLVSLVAAANLSFGVVLDIYLAAAIGVTFLAAKSRLRQRFMTS